MIEEIATERLVLQPIDQLTAAAIVAGDLGALNAGVGWPRPNTIDGLRMEAALGGEPACWLVLCSGEVIGELGWKGGPGPDGTIEIGYSLAPRYRGRGYGTEAVVGFVQWALREPAVRRIVAETRADNFASRRVLEKAGFTITGPREHYVDWLLGPPAAVDVP